MIMDKNLERPRAFVFLQGPPGPLFSRLATTMRARGVAVHRINLSAGDQLDWAGPAVNFRGRRSEWAVFFDHFLREQQITDILLFGDCRPYHVTARRLAAMRGVRTHVLEEGYLRPHWMTLELEGVNAHSPISRDPARVFEQARRLPREQVDEPPVTASFRRRVRDTARYYTAVQAGALIYPFYENHRQHTPLFEGLGWSWRYLTRKLRERELKRGLAAIEGKRFFLHALQLSGDFQIRAHSPFTDMPSATSYVLQSFAMHAAPDMHLLIKAHPLDGSFFNWRGFLRRRARKLRISDRVHYIDGGDIEELAANAEGMVVVNSTSATLALSAGRPVCVLGDAIYNIPGLTFGGHLDSFWRDPPPPVAGLYEAFRKVLVNDCLVRGGLASESAVTTLVDNMADRLCAPVKASDAVEKRFHDPEMLGPAGRTVAAEPGDLRVPSRAG
ncbi:capsular biosynthesis protein [Sphingomonas sp. KRR8]|uniref:capsule biosynthesis protein n=1 Tax=Sphingomonas sp. KRR8 TaxID=2942996 RepID=UPI002020E350|nr:capsular biosynthesis protein [Sphingomonas sp. KRR8]URD60551.1 capsular biosynthesis protein [Sphingomonas sp. KRR8]